MHYGWRHQMLSLVKQSTSKLQSQSTANCHNTKQRKNHPQTQSVNSPSHSVSDQDPTEALFLQHVCLYRNYPVPRLQISLFPTCQSLSLLQSASPACLDPHRQAGTCSAPWNLLYFQHEWHNCWPCPTVVYFGTYFTYLQCPPETLY